MAQTVARVRVWDRDEQRVRTMTNLDCRFTYRHSLFKGTDRYVVIDVMFQLVLASLSQPVAYADLAAQLGVAVGTRVPLADAREAVLAQRRRRGMVLDAPDHDTWSCGSFFTNPVLSVEEFAALESRVGRAARRRRAGTPAVPVRRRRGQDQCCVADRARRLREGATGRRARPPCRPSTPSR